MATLITGAAGFIGYHLSRRLAQRGDNVVGIDCINDYYDPRLKRARLAELDASCGGRFEFIKVDFSDMKALDEALRPIALDRIVHLGAQAGVRYSIQNPHAYVQANLVGHVNMLEIARHRAVRNFVYASSSSVYGGNKELPFRVEERVDHPVSLYAATKRADELISESYAHLYRIPQTGLRFFTAYGPWGRPDMAMWLFAEKILAGRPIQVFNHGKMRRDFTYIDDIVEGITRCHDQPPPDDGLEKAGGSIAPHRLYNIGNNRSEDLMQMVGLIEQACGRKAEVEFLPMQAGDVAETFADITAIQADLGYAPSTAIDVGVPRFVEWYKNYHGIA